ncbi:MAG: hypothetical protein O7I93_10330 [Gemmatimonadetes bacterium]|nr:hypothetical protein [Gemmatimonadota bacterium]
MASLIVPGTGQLLTKKTRGWAYLAAEGLLVAGYMTFQSTGNSQGNLFRDIAFSVARAPFSPTVRDTAFQYFEHMEKFVASGAFDTDPGDAFVPPTDESTFNGSIWALARRTFLSDPDAPDPSSPDYQRAIEFYRRRAVGPNFLWTWDGAAAAHNEFRDAVGRSNDGYRRASLALGFLLANHLTSFLDAFVSARLGGPETAASFSTSLQNGGIGRLAPQFRFMFGMDF